MTSVKKSRPSRLQTCPGSGDLASCLWPLDYRTCGVRRQHAHRRSAPPRSCHWACRHAPPDNIAKHLRNVVQKPGIRDPRNAPAHLTRGRRRCSVATHPPADHISGSGARKPARRSQGFSRQRVIQPWTKTRDLSQPMREHRSPTTVLVSTIGTNATCFATAPAWRPTK